MELKSSEWFGGVLQHFRPASVAECADLKHFQLVAARRLANTADRFGAAICADATGLGKTRTCILAAILLRRESHSTRPIVVYAPARLLENWRATLEHLGVAKESAVVFSHQRLSKGQIGPEASVVIVDEAHRFKNPKALRTINLQRAIKRAPTILASATPVINSIWDLYNLLALCIDDRTSIQICGWDLRVAFERAEAGIFDLTDLLSDLVVRRVDSVDPGLKRPKVCFEVLRYTPQPAEAWVWEHLDALLDSMNFALFKGDWPRGLMVEHIRRVWEGGADCLLNFVDYIVNFHQRWLELNAQGRSLQRSEFETCFGTHHTQSTFAFMFEESHELLGRDRVDGITSDLEKWQRLQARLSVLADERTGVEEAICGLISSEPDAPLLVFASFQKSAEALFQTITRFLGPKARVALVTGSGARATGLGRSRADEIVARFAPVAHGVELPDHHRIQILVCTDCLSEGVNLQDCGRLVLADLPYTPQAIEQRIGRIVRPGSQHTSVRVWLPRPHSWNDSLGLQRKIRDKMDAADRAGSPFENMTRRDRPKPTTQAIGPLAALSRLDELAQIHGDSHDLEGKHWTMVGSRPWVWALIRIKESDSTRYRVVVWDDRGEVEAARWLSLTEDLIHTHDPLTASGEPAIVEEYANDLAARLNGGLLAPTRLHTVQLDLWKWIKTQDLSESEYQSARSKLLQPLTRSELSALPEPGQLKGFWRALERIPLRSREPVEVEVLTSLQVINREANEAGAPRSHAREGETRTDPQLLRC